MQVILDLYRCRRDIAEDGMFTLEGFVRELAPARATAETKPVMDTLCFTHRRRHSVYFRRSVPRLAHDHPALALIENTNHTVCCDQIP